LLGAHLIGHEVTEQIHTFAAAMVGEATDSELAHMIFAHPSMAESLHESVLGGRGENLNL
jgi:dihydrolipoamide dehydrogenase